MPTLQNHTIIYIIVMYLEIVKLFLRQLLICFFNARAIRSIAATSFLAAGAIRSRRATYSPATGPLPRYRLFQKIGV